MLIDIEFLCNKYAIKDFGVLHIGAHKGEERAAYANAGAISVVWIEANPRLADNLRRKITEKIFHFELVLEAAVFDEEGRDVEFTIATDSQASSILEFAEVSDRYPAIKTQEKIKIQTRRVDSLADENKEEFAGLNFANLDIQGAELGALRGFGEKLSSFKWIYTEVNRSELYKDNGMIWEIDKFLLKNRFFRRETVFTEHHWGDAFYQKETDRGLLYILLYKILLNAEYLFWKVTAMPLYIKANNLYYRSNHFIKRVIRKLVSLLGPS